MRKSENVLNYASPGTIKRSRQFSQKLTICAGLSSWLVSFGVLIWSDFAIRHFQHVAGQTALWSTSNADHYAAWSIEIQSVIGLAAFITIPLIVTVIVFRGRYSLGLWALLLLSHVLAFVVLLFGLANMAQLVYP